MGAPQWDPYNAAQRRAPYDAWRRLRDEAPLYRNEQYGFYALSRFQDVLDAALDTETFSSARGITLDAVGRAPGLPMMITMDPPRHDAMRRLVNRAYTPRRVAQLEDRIRSLCASYLDPLVGRDAFDYMHDFGARLPVMVISSLLGFPEADHDQLRQWSDRLLHRDEGVERPGEDALSVVIETFGYYNEQIQQRRGHPGDDLVSALLACDLEDVDGTVRPLTDLEVIGMVGLISHAGNETVARMLGWAAVVLAANPSQRAELVADPTLVPDAIEELLRYEAPAPVEARYVTRDVELHGEVVPERATMALLAGSAGRDERQYVDPDRFDVHRRAERHLSFGYGAHYCLGAALARLEGRVAIEETLRRFPEWDVDHDRVTLVSTHTVRGPASVPMRV